MRPLTELFGVGGLIYAGLVCQLVFRLGKGGLIVTGGFLITAAYVVLTFQRAWWPARVWHFATFRWIAEFGSC
jgi:hypothetical protein